MTFLYDACTVRTHATPELALESIRRALEAENNNLAGLSPRHDVATSNGFLRVMPGYLDGVMGVKVMVLVNGLGTRYVLLLHEIGNWRVAGRIRRRRAHSDPYCRDDRGRSGRNDDRSPHVSRGHRIGIRSGGHLRMFAAMWPLDQATVFSPNADRRSASPRPCPRSSIYG